MAENLSNFNQPCTSSTNLPHTCSTNLPHNSSTTLPSTSTTNLPHNSSTSLPSTSTTNLPTTSNTNPRTITLNKKTQHGTEPLTSSPGSKVCNHDVQNNVNLGEQQARSNPINFTLGEIALPRYGDKSHEHPIKFIRDLEQFFELRNVPLELRKSV